MYIYIMAVFLLIGISYIKAIYIDRKNLHRNTYFLAYIYILVFSHII